MKCPVKMVELEKKALTDALTGTENGYQYLMVKDAVLLEFLFFCLQAEDYNAAVDVWIQTDRHLIEFLPNSIVKYMEWLKAKTPGINE